MITPRERVAIADACRSAIDAIEREMPGELYRTRRDLERAALIADGMTWDAAERRVDIEVTS